MSCGIFAPGSRVAVPLRDQSTKRAQLRYTPVATQARAALSTARTFSHSTSYAANLTQLARGSLERCRSLLAACLLTGLISTCPVQAVPIITDTIQSSNLVVSKQLWLVLLVLCNALFVSL